MKLTTALSAAIILCISGCVSNENKLAIPEWGVITNPSAEIVHSSEIEGWQTDPWLKGATHFYDNIAHQGTKSLFIDAPGFADGIWQTKVLLKPWSKYLFTGWIRTRGIVPENGRGSGFVLGGLDVEPKGFTGDNEWTRVAYEFNTGGKDCTVLQCLLNVDGKAKGRAWFDDMKFTLVSEEKINTAVNIDLTKESEQMPVYIYGQFIEHLGRCIYGGIWSEMVNDRKFWYSPGDKDSPWIVEGGRVEMDEKNPFVGTHTPVFVSDDNNHPVLLQKGLGIRQGINVTGHVVLKSSSKDMSASITLSWGDGESNEVKTVITGLTNEYKSYPVELNVPVSSKDVTLKIAPIGKGRLWLGTISLMPSDNVEGFRADVLALLHELNAPVYRWPGGNFVSGYDWKDGIGDRDKRPPRKNPAWSGVEPNDVGIHEFMRFCDLLKTEPYIAVNAGLGGVEMARSEVEYLNGEPSSPMGKLRTKNGHSEPWHVKWWSVGNEMFGDWQLGHMSTQSFVEKHNAFSAAMKSVSPGIHLIAVGDVGNWDKMILSNCADNMDYVSEHFYKQDWHGGGLMTHIRQIPDEIKRKADAHRQYRDSIPGLKDKDIRICMDEWNYWYGPNVYGELGTRYFYRDAMGIAAGINEYSRNTDIIYMANYAQTVNVIGAIKTNTTDAVLDATGMVLKLYRKVFGKIPVAITGETRPLDIAATLTAGGDTLTISVVNPTYDEAKVPVSVSGGSFSGKVEEWNVTSVDDMSTNEPGQDPSVKITGPLNVGEDSILLIKPVSISIFVIPIEKNKTNF
jgi:alpha-L-arabinofuranosidase